LFTPRIPGEPTAAFYPIAQRLYYMFYLEQVREVWGKSVNLKPMGQLDAVRA
jgi:hypothetical protein